MRFKLVQMEEDGQYKIMDGMNFVAKAFDGEIAGRLVKALNFAAYMGEI